MAHESMAHESMTHESMALTRSIVLWCPDWPVRALVRAELIADGAPAVLIEKGVVFACSAAARADGVRRGLRVREAQARCTALVTHPYDPAFDARSFESVLTAIEQLMPGVQVIRPGMCALRSRGPSRYYGGERAAAAALLGLLAEHGVPDARIGIADGPFAAEQAARRASAGHAGAGRIRIIAQGGSPAFLADLPVSVIDDPSFVALAVRLGIHTLGAVAALDEAAVHSRFGQLGKRIHSLASGRDADTVVPRVPLPSLERSVEFEPGLDRVDQVAFGFRATADDFLAGLTHASLVCTAVLVQVFTESDSVFERTWLHPRWFTAADVVDRVRWQLQGADLRSAVVRVAVSPESVDAIGNHEVGLWGNGPDERIHHALSRVQSMLGHEAVLTAVVGGGRMLGERQLLVPWGDPPPASHTVRAGQPWPGSLPTPLPTTVFAPPRPVAVFTNAGDSVDVTERGQVTGEPAWFSVTGSRDDASSITTWAGPWPIAERWWDASQASSIHRFHIVEADGMAWLLFLEEHRWWAEARYD
jgi:protein ImuB